MAELTKETIQNLSQLSRIGCTESEQESLTQDLKKILSYVNLLQEIDTEGVLETCNVIHYDTHLTRQDEVKNVMNRKDFLSNTEELGGFVKIPSVFSKKG